MAGFTTISAAAATPSAAAAPCRSAARDATTIGRPMMKKAESQMKLLTELRTLKSGGHSLGYNEGDLQHDAAVAHALMHAIRSCGPTVRAMHPETFLLIAREKLAEWGIKQ